MAPHTVRKKIATLTTAALVALGLSILDASPAAGAATTGYVRLAHLSPDAPAVDVYLNSATGAIAERIFRAVPYGAMTQYMRLPTGAYAVAMRGVNAPANSQAILTTQVVVEDGRAYTVAGVGKAAELGLRVIPDDITLPVSGKAKVRIVQASVRAPVLGVAVSGGETIANDVAFATTTPYQQVAPGKWTLQVKPAGGGQTSTLQATLASGNVYSLLVLDAAGGGLKAELRIDSRLQGGVPVGAVDTGAGGTDRSPRTMLFLVGGAIVLLCGVTATTMRLRRVYSRRL